MLGFTSLLQKRTLAFFSGMTLIKKVIPPNGKNHSATVIFFHGSGDTGHNLVEWIRILLGRDMQHPHIKFIYPTAPVQPYTPLEGDPSNVWFDRESISIDAKESTESLAAIYKTVNELIQDEVDEGIPPERIIVGGFSMGGALALHLGYLLNTKLAGVFACSSFLNRGSQVYDALRKRSTLQDSDSNSNLPELLMFHGDRDSLVPAGWGQETFEELNKLGVKGEFVLLKNTLHELKKKEMITLEEWIIKQLNPENGDVQNKL